MPSRGGFVRIPRGPARFRIALWPAAVLLVRIRKRHPLWALSPCEKNPSLSFLIHYLGGIAMGIPTLMGIRGGSSETGLCSASVGFVLTVLAASSRDSQESGHQMLTSVSPPKQSQLGGQKWKGRGRRGSVRVLPLPPVHKPFPGPAACPCFTPGREGPKAHPESPETVSDGERSG